MQNENIIYIDYIDSYLEILNDKFPDWIRKLVYTVLKFLGYVKVNKNKITLCCLKENEINKRMISNLKNKLSIINSKDVVLSNLLMENNKFINILENIDYNILNGRWLYKFLCYDFVCKIAYIKNKKISDMEITILSNENSEINIENIKLLANECKILNIVTEDLDKFKHIENLLFNEYGNMINVSTNKLKTCKYSDIILNFDFSLEQIKKCNFKKGATVVQFTKEKFESNNVSTIVFYKLNMPAKYLQLFNENKRYNQEIFYESLLYYKTSFKDVRKILKKDNVSIKYFIGCNGKMPFNQIKNLLLYA